MLVCSTRVSSGAGPIFGECYHVEAFVGLVQLPAGPTEGLLECHVVLITLKIG
jgi:hypothetical protein